MRHFIKNILVNIGQFFGVRLYSRDEITIAANQFVGFKSREVYAEVEKHKKITDDQIQAVMSHNKKLQTQVIKLRRKLKKGKP